MRQIILMASQCLPCSCRAVDPMLSSERQDSYMVHALCIWVLDDCRWIFGYCITVLALSPVRHQHSRPLADTPLVKTHLCKAKLIMLLARITPHVSQKASNADCHAGNMTCSDHTPLNGTIWGVNWHFWEPAVQTSHRVTKQEWSLLNAEPLKCFVRGVDVVHNAVLLCFFSIVCDEPLGPWVIL